MKKAVAQTIFSTILQRKKKKSVNAFSIRGKSKEE